MFRWFVSSLFTILLVGGGVLAGDYDFKGTITRLHTSRPTLTVGMDGRDETFRITSDTVFVDEQNRTLRDGLDSNRLRPRTFAKILTEGKGRMDIAARVQIGR